MLSNSLPGENGEDGSDPQGEKEGVAFEGSLWLTGHKAKKADAAAKALEAAAQDEEEDEEAEAAEADSARSFWPLRVSTGHGTRAGVGARLAAKLFCCATGRWLRLRSRLRSPRQLKTLKRT